MATLKDQIRQFLAGLEGGQFALDATREGELSDQLAAAMGKQSTAGVAKAVIELISGRELETVKKGGVVTVVRLPARDRVAPVFSDLTAKTSVHEGDPWHIVLSKALASLRLHAGENASVGSVLKGIGLSDKRHIAKAMTDLRALDVYKTRRFAFGKSTYDLLTERTSVTEADLAELKSLPVTVGAEVSEVVEQSTGTSDLLVLVAELTTRLEAARQDAEVRAQLEDEVTALRAENDALKAKLAKVQQVPDELRDRLKKLGIEQLA